MLKFMKISDEQKFAYTCQDVGEVLFLYAVWPQELSIDERKETPKHLIKCLECRYTYDKLKEVAPAIRENPEILLEYGFSAPDQEDSSSRRPTQEEINQARFEARLERVVLRRRRREKRERLARIKCIAWSVSTVAACIIAVFGLYLTVNYLNGNGNNVQNIAENPESTVKIEMITPSGTQIIQPAHPIMTSNGLKILKINNNRRIVLNVNTKLSILPNNLGCIVKLDKGEIFAVVQHDGKPCIVETAHGRAVITGTTFNIKTDDTKMELAVAEGSVKFEGDNGSVNVTANQKSTMAKNAKPTIPRLCDTAKLTAWAKDSKQGPIFAAKESEIDLGSIFNADLINLDRIHYKTWIQQKRSWFKSEFPHIFKFKEVLDKEGIESDYPDLLIKSGDLWRFAFPEKTQSQLIPTNYESMLKLASEYNKDAKWLSDNLNLSKANLKSQNETSTLKALEQWAKALQGSLDSPAQISDELLINSLHASIYLSETRILAWLALYNEQPALTPTEKQKAAKLLEQEIKAANNCVAHFKKMFAESISSSPCDVEKQRKELLDIIGTIEEIEEVQNELRSFW